MYLERDDLIKLCAKIEQPTNGNNDDLIAKLQRKIKYCHLTKPMLVAIARPLGIPASETKDNIINKLVEEKKSKKIVSQLQQITITESKGKAKEKDNKKEQEKEKTKKETSPHKSKEKVSEKGKSTPLSVERYYIISSPLSHRPPLPPLLQAYFVFKMEPVPACGAGHVM